MFRNQKCFCFIFLFFVLSQPVLANDFSFLKYKIKKGDTLSKILQNDQEKILFVMKLNRIDAHHLRVGQTLLIPQNWDNCKKFCPVPRFVNDNDRRLLVIHLDKQYFGAYQNGTLLFWGPISSGCEGHKTPKGIFRAKSKQRYKFSKKYKAKMPYSVQINGDYFFHEQSLPGKPASHGCVRLLRQDAKRLFYWFHVGDKIIIK